MIDIKFMVVLVLITQHCNGQCGLEELCKSPPCEKVRPLTQQGFEKYNTSVKTTPNNGTFFWLEKEKEYGIQYCTDGDKASEYDLDAKVFCTRRFGDSEEQMYCTTRRNELKRMCGEGELCKFPCDGATDWKQIFGTDTVDQHFKNFTIYNWEEFLRKVGMRYCISGKCIRDVQTNIQNDNLQYVCTGDYKKCADGEMCQLPCQKPQNQLPKTDYPIFAFLNQPDTAIEQKWTEYVHAMGRRFCKSGKCTRRNPKAGDHTMICEPTASSPVTITGNPSTLVVLTILSISAYIHHFNLDS